MNDPMMGLIGNLTRRLIDAEKRVSRLETLEFSSAGGIGPGSGGCWVEIETITAGPGGTAVFTFAGIPELYLHLCLILSLRSRGTIGSMPFYLRFNNDAAANYTGQNAAIDDAGVSSSAAAGGTELFLGCCPGLSFEGAPIYEDVFSGGHVWIPDYRCYKDRKRFTIGDNFCVAADQEELLAGYSRQMTWGVWHNVVAPINRIDIGFTGNFEKNSKVSLYGIKGTYECHL